MADSKIFYTFNPILAAKWILIMINEQDYTEILQRAVALLPWSHNVLILSKDLSFEDEKAKRTSVKGDNMEDEL